MRSQFAIAQENKMNKKIPAPSQNINSMIRTIRRRRVILVYDLARIFGVPTFRFNEAIKRNRRRFPSDFMLQLTMKEFLALRSQIATLERAGNPSQIAVGSQKHRNPRHSPHAFTEHGAIMAANILNSPRAVRMSVYVVRAFVQMRNLLGSTKDLAKQLALLEKK